MTYTDLADRLGVSESTLKRWFSQNSFNIEVLDDLCEHLHISLSDLLPARKEPLVQQQLTEDQELALASDDTLLIVFYLLVAGHKAKDIMERYDMTLPRMTKHLLALDAAGLIELHGGNRVVPKVTQSVRWLSRGPLHEKYGRQIRLDFMDSSFDGKNEGSWLISEKMSPSSLSVFHRKLEVLLKEFRDLVELDANLPAKDTLNVTFFAGYRPWTLPIIRKPKPAKGADERGKEGRGR